MLFDLTTLYNIIYLACSCIVIYHNDSYRYFYGFLLLDVVNLSESLRNILKSITLNFMNLSVFGFFGLVILYCFAVVGFK